MFRGSHTFNYFYKNIIEMEPIYRAFTIGHYESNGEVLGQGGFAIVFKGWDNENDRDVAIRFIRFFTYLCLTSRNEKYTSPKLIQQLEKEIQILRQVQHPNVVQLFDYVVSLFYFLLLF